MCIAIISESGVSLPKKTVLKRCFKNNPDGAGYAVLLADNTWEGKKGFMTWKTFWKAFNNERYTKDDTVLIHFRIGTSGKKEHPDCTHPFPITENEEELMKHHFISKSIIMHNGTCGQGRKDLSDTMVAIVDYVDPLLPHIENEKMLNILHKCIGTSSRWFIANGNSSWMLGDWDEEKETGLWYSNRGYLPPAKTTTTHYNYTSHYSYTPWYKGKEKEPVISYTGSSKLMYYKKGIWSWDKWEQFNRPLLAAPKKDDTTYEVFDEEGNLSMIIDIDGNTLWEKPDDTTIPFDCPYCTNTIADDVISDLGECPFCYEVVSVPPGKDTNDDACCPNCGEDSYLIEPMYNNADTECCKCGENI